MSLCPVCSKPSLAATKPFCSARCREVDLNRWFTGSYAVPAVELDDVDDESLAEAARIGGVLPDES
ncbi:MAG: DNA gyrase inhibitor YacG [Pseudomonadota bacterium]